MRPLYSTQSSGKRDRQSARGKAEDAAAHPHEVIPISSVVDRQMVFMSMSFEDGKVLSIGWAMGVAYRERGLGGQLAMIRRI